MTKVKQEVCGTAGNQNMSLEPQDSSPNIEQCTLAKNQVLDF